MDVVTQKTCSPKGFYAHSADDIRVGQPNCGVYHSVILHDRIIKKVYSFRYRDNEPGNCYLLCRLDQIFYNGPNGKIISGSIFRNPITHGNSSGCIFNFVFLHTGFMADVSGINLFRRVSYLDILQIFMMS